MNTNSKSTVRYQDSTFSCPITIHSSNASQLVACTDCRLRHDSHQTQDSPRNSHSSSLPFKYLEDIKLCLSSSYPNPPHPSQGPLSAPLLIIHRDRHPKRCKYFMSSMVWSPGTLLLVFTITVNNR